MSEMKLRIDCDWLGQRLAITHTMNRLDVEYMIPPREVLTPMDYADYLQAAERRKRVVDMLSANIAHAVTDALIKQFNERAR